MHTIHHIRSQRRWAVTVCLTALSQMNGHTGRAWPLDILCITHQAVSSCTHRDVQTSFAILGELRGPPLHYCISPSSHGLVALPALPSNPSACMLKPHHVHSAEDMAVVVAGLQVLGDVSKGAEVFRVLGCTGDVSDFMLSDDVLGRDRGVQRADLSVALFTLGFKIRIGPQMDNAKYQCKRPPRCIVIHLLKPLAEVIWDEFDHRGLALESFFGKH